MDMFGFSEFFLENHKFLVKIKNLRPQNGDLIFNNFK